MRDVYKISNILKNAVIGDVSQITEKLCFVEMSVQANKTELNPSDHRSVDSYTKGQ